MRGRLSLLIAAVALASCDAGAPRSEQPVAGGPPTVRGGIVTAHATQFDEELPERPAGSQHEQIAATYILGTLQRAGYRVLLDRVPVANLVNSTNVIAHSPGAEEPVAVVVVSYDSGPGPARSGHAIGLFLEAARALMVRDPGHAVSFAALGAERTASKGGRLGSRRLAQDMLDQGVAAAVIVIQNVTPRGASGGGRARAPVEVDTAEVFDAAGFETTTIEGGAAAAARRLLRRLTGLTQAAVRR